MTSPQISRLRDDILERRDTEDSLLLGTNGLSEGVFKGPYQISRKFRQLQWIATPFRTR